MARSDKAATPATLDPKNAAEPTSKAAKPVAPDVSDEQLAYVARSLTRAALTDGERAIAIAVRAMILTDIAPASFLGDLPYTPGVDSVHAEYQLRRGRADLVLFHVDGSASVIEIKDGRQGITTLLAGIGQVTDYAVHLKMFGGVHTVHRALMWTAIQTEEHNPMVTAACREAGVEPLAALSREHILAALLVTCAMQSVEAPHGTPP